MRVTNVLYKLHIGRFFNLHWYMKSKKVPVETGTEAAMKERGIKLTDPFELIRDPLPKINIKDLNVIGTQDPPILMDESHPLYNSQPCFEYKDNSVLVEGLHQALVFTNTVEVKKGLPLAIEDLVESSKNKSSENLDEQVKRCIMNYHLYDAYQEKLPKIKDPLRPAFNFPRVLGVADHRRNRLMTERLLELCFAVGERSPGLVARNAPVQTFVSRGGSLVKMDVTPGALLTCSQPVSPHADYECMKSAADATLPDMFPLNSTVSLNTTHFYNTKEIFPLPKTFSTPHIHTALLHFNETQVKNLYEEPVTERQVLGRSLMHTYTLAVAAAKQRFGDKLQDNVTLPEPVTVQAVHTDSQWFHFLVFQLNSLGAEGTRNIMWSTPIMKLFSTCQYDTGVPVLTDYNPQVFNTFLAFYNTAPERN